MMKPNGQTLSWKRNLDEYTNSAFSVSSCIVLHYECMGAFHHLILLLELVQRVFSKMNKRPKAFQSRFIPTNFHWTKFMVFNCNRERHRTVLTRHWAFNLCVRSNSSIFMKKTVGVSVCVFLSEPSPNLCTPKKIPNGQWFGVFFFYFDVQFAKIDSNYKFYCKLNLFRIFGFFCRYSVFPNSMGGTKLQQLQLNIVFIQLIDCIALKTSN